MTSCFAYTATGIGVLATRGSRQRQRLLLHRAELSKALATVHCMRRAREIHAEKGQAQSEEGNRSHG